MNRARSFVAMFVWASLILVSSSLTIRQAGAEGTTSPLITLATLVQPGRIVDPGDLLRTTRIFPNWNLNCEVLLSQGRHLCAVELRSIDVQGRQVFAWSIALSADGNPVIVFRFPSDLDQGYGLRMVIGQITTVLTPRQTDCGPSECRLIEPFDSGLRSLVVSQRKILFMMKRAGGILQIEAPLAGLSEALEMARQDPIGLLATQRLSPNISKVVKSKNVRSTERVDAGELSRSKTINK